MFLSQEYDPDDPMNAPRGIVNALILTLMLAIAGLICWLIIF